MEGWRGRDYSDESIHQVLVQSDGVGSGARPDDAGCGRPNNALANRDANCEADRVANCDANCDADYDADCDADRVANRDANYDADTGAYVRRSLGHEQVHHGWEGPEPDQQP